MFIVVKHCNATVTVKMPQYMAYMAPWVPLYALYIEYVPSKVLLYGWINAICV